MTIPQQLDSNVVNTVETECKEDKPSKTLPSILDNTVVEEDQQTIE